MLPTSCPPSSIHCFLAISFKHSVRSQKTLLFAVSAAFWSRENKLKGLYPVAFAGATRIVILHWALLKKRKQEGLSSMAAGSSSVAFSFAQRLSLPPGIPAQAPITARTRGPSGRLVCSNSLAPVWDSADSNQSPFPEVPTALSEDQSLSCELRFQPLCDRVPYGVETSIMENIDQHGANSSFQQCPLSFSNSAFFNLQQVSDYNRRSQAFHDKREQRLKCSRPNLRTEFAQFSCEVLLEHEVATTYFNAALEQAPYDVELLRSFASFSWRQCNDKSLAEELYQRALHVCPQDAETLASYALFLWESE